MTAIAKQKKKHMLKLPEENYCGGSSFHNTLRIYIEYTSSSYTYTFTLPFVLIKIYVLYYTHASFNYQIRFVDVVRSAYTVY